MLFSPNKPFNRKGLHRAILSCKNVHHTIMLKEPVTVFVHLLWCVSKYTSYDSLVDCKLTCWRQGNESIYLIRKWKILIRVTMLAHTNPEIKMSCNYGAKLMAFFSSTELWAVHDFKNSSSMTCDDARARRVTISY